MADLQFFCNLLCFWTGPNSIDELTILEFNSFPLFFIPNTQRKLLEEADQGTLAPMLAAAARRGSSRCRSSARRGGSRCRSSVRCGGSRCSSSARGGGSGCSSAAHRGASRCSSVDQRVPELLLQLGAADGALVAGKN